MECRRVLFRSATPGPGSVCRAARPRFRRRQRCAVAGAAIHHPALGARSAGADSRCATIARRRAALRPRRDRRHSVRLLNAVRTPMVTTQSTDTCAVTADFALRDELRLLGNLCHDATNGRSEEHTSELQSLMRISYAVFCLKKKTNISTISHIN